MSESAKKRILIVDDETYIRRLLGQILEEEYEIVAQAGNGLEALQKYRSAKPDLVLMDIMMPGIDGLRALKDIKNEDPKAKVIMLTAVSDQANVKEAITSGACGYVTKPIFEDKLLDSIKKALE